MKEIRIHGRGGQGAVTGSEILAEAAMREGKYSQSFPTFGAERRGAPLVAFTRIDDKPIRLRCQVYEADYLIILDLSIIQHQDLTIGLKPWGTVVINTPLSAEEVEGTGIIMKGRTCVVDASSIAMEFLGSPIPNTVILGAFSAATEEVSLQSLCEVVENRFPKSVSERNIAAMKEANKSISLRKARARARYIEMSKPYWTKKNFPSTPIIRNPGGSLAFKCGQWRTVKPIIDAQKCNKCGLCALYCPDDSIEKTGKEIFEVKYDYCKGCGICANECPPKAIRMVAEAREICPT